MIRFFVLLGVVVGLVTTALASIEQGASPQWFIVAALAAVLIVVKQHRLGLVAVAISAVSLVQASLYQADRQQLFLAMLLAVLVCGVLRAVRRSLSPVGMGDMLFGSIDALICIDVTVLLYQLALSGWPAAAMVVAACLLMVAGLIHTFMIDVVVTVITLVLTAVLMGLYPERWAAIREQLIMLVALMALVVAVSLPPQGLRRR